MDIELSRGKVAIVDVEDYGLVAGSKWSAKSSKGNWYAVARINGKEVFMHNLLLGRVDGFEVDHCDQNGLNNQRSNLRRSTRSQNRANVSLRKDNKSGFKGVCFSERLGKWRAYIQVDGRWKQIGVFANKKEAAKAYNKEAVKHFGEFAWLNPIL